MLKFDIIGVKNPKKAAKFGKSWFKERAPFRSSHCDGSSTNFKYKVIQIDSGFEFIVILTQRWSLFNRSWKIDTGYHGDISILSYKRLRRRLGNIGSDQELSDVSN